jgi:hypothetical protein
MPSLTNDRVMLPILLHRLLLMSRVTSQALIHPTPLRLVTRQVQMSGSYPRRLCIQPMGATRLFSLPRAGPYEYEYAVVGCLLLQI